MNPKIEKLEKDIQKTNAKIAELQKKVSDMQDQKTELENADYPFDNFIENRTHSISGVYQCKFKEDVAHSCSYAYITNSSFDNMPDELYVLFAYDKDEIDARVCPFDTIIIRKDEHTILGRYKAEEPVGEDCLLFYRKYVKDNSNGTLCLFFEQKGKETKFYHANPFFNLTTVSDDDEFIKRTQLPF